MSYKPRTLFRLIEEINSSLFLPHIQRPFVWDEEQMERLFDSLMRNYPIQTLLFWRTRDEIKVRKFMEIIDWDADLHEYYNEAMSAEGVEKVFVLDGQQRLQTLLALFKGGIYSSDDRDVMAAYLDITDGEVREDTTLTYRLKFSKEKLSLPYFQLRDLLGKYAQRNSEEIADQINEELDILPHETSKEERSNRQKRVRRNISQLVSLLREEKHFWAQELDGVADAYPYKKILEIFVRVNSGGTKLSAADLMFAAMKEEWGEIEENVEDVVNMLNENSLNFDKNLVLKAIVTTLGVGAELTPEKFTSSAGERLLKQVQDAWTTLEATFSMLRDFIIHDLRLYGDKVVRSYNSFIPLFDYMYHNGAPTEHDRVLMRAYYYKSQLFNWYSARTDNLVNAMHTIVGKQGMERFPLEAIKEYFRTQRGTDVELSPDDMNMRLRYILLNLVYVQQFGTSPFNVRYKGNEPHIDHIYPQSMLRSQLGLATSDINDLGNYRLVGATDNIRKRAELPDSYFSRLKKQGIDLKPHLLVKDYSFDPAQLKFDTATYNDFRNRRREQIYEIAKQIVDPELVSISALRANP